MFILWNIVVLLLQLPLNTKIWDLHLDRLPKKGGKSLQYEDDGGFRSLSQTSDINNENPVNEPGEWGIIYKDIHRTRCATHG